MVDIINNPGRQCWAALTERAASDTSAELALRVNSIVERVKNEGDKALHKLSIEIDGVEIDDFLVSQDQIQQACLGVRAELKEAMKVAAQNIETFHTAQRFQEIKIETTAGVSCSQRAVPISRVGLYIPGGSAPLFSTVLMLAIPAKVAGCKEIILATPPDKTGGVAPEILYAAWLCGVSKIYKIGGAQAIAAMAYGTQTIGRVDKIFGPGNRYVTQAKQQLGGSVVAIDMPAGPSEVMILADSEARADFVAADMLSQAEHGADSQALTVCHSMEFASRINVALREQLAKLERQDIASTALLNSKIIVFDDPDNFHQFANQYAAEHLIISMRDPWSVASKITAAGSIFIGNYTPESAGDYASGTNHTLPTSAWARSMSGVNLDSFTRKITYQEITQQGLEKLGPVIQTMAQGEGLTAHREAVSIRLK